MSINHPFLHVWKWKFHSIPLRMVQFLEIVNDPTYEYAKESNEKAIRFLDLLWQEGYRIYGIGGSDSHNLIEERYDGALEPSVAGDPGTYVFSKGLTPTKLLQNLRKGHVYVSRYCTLEVELQPMGKTIFRENIFLLEQRKRCVYNIRWSFVDWKSARLYML